jgi:hypothetical protein
MRRQADVSAEAERRLLSCHASIPRRGYRGALAVTRNVVAAILFGIADCASSGAGPALPSASEPAQPPDPVGEARDTVIIEVDVASIPDADKPVCEGKARRIGSRIFGKGCYSRDDSIYRSAGSSQPIVTWRLRLKYLVGDRSLVDSG